MNDDDKARVIELAERGDVYGLMLASVGLWVGAYHPRAKRASLYASEQDGMEPTRIKIPLSASSSAT